MLIIFCNTDHILRNKEQSESLYSEALVCVFGIILYHSNNRSIVFYEKLRSKFCLPK